MKYLIIAAGLLALYVVMPDRPQSAACERIADTLIIYGSCK